MTPAHYWHAILDDDPDQAVYTAMALWFAARVDAAVLRRAADRISHMEGVGLILDPSAWTDGSRFDHAREARRVLLALADLVAALPEPPEAP